MKKLLLSAIIASTLFASCQKTNTPAPDARNVPGGINAKNRVAINTDVYVTGSISNGIDVRPAYWKNGVATVLPVDAAGVNTSGASAIAVSGADVYVSGTDNNAACYWKNGVRVMLPTTNPTNPQSATYGIAVKGSDVYVVGNYYGGDVNEPRSVNALAVMWKNGVPSLLAFNKQNSFARSIAIDGNDIYICGSSEVGDVSVPVYWKNHIYHTFAGTTINGSATAITVDKNHNFYIAGTYSNGSVVPVRVFPCYWKDGNIRVLGPDVQPNSLPQTTSIAVDSLQNVYVGGYVAGAGYWKNGHFASLPSAVPSNFYNPISAIAVNNGDVYAAAEVGPPLGATPYSGAGYKNGTPALLPGIFGFATSIIVVQH